MMVSESDVSRETLHQAAQVARTDSCVLITGETGTGKELLAQFIHEQSTRRSQPLIKVDCSSLPESLIESELFGHEAGAFTGAQN
ncbi:MAG: sigma 54-interacting transcriptional regulator, partial [Planctomycetota bacterium]